MKPREYEMILYGDPRTKKNNPLIVNNKRNGRAILLPSKQYRDYEKEARKQIPDMELPIDYPVEVECHYYMRTRRKVDLTNLLEATDDILVKAGVLEDDNCRVIQSHDGSRVSYDKDNPRAEIRIRELISFDKSMMMP